nr:phosphotransferase [Desulfobacula sp.]
MQEFSDPSKGEFLQWLHDQWGLELPCVREDIEIQGSPERTISRVVVQDRDGRLFLLEKFPAEKFQVRDQVAKAVDFLNLQGLFEALPYRKSDQGEFLPFFRGACFQLSSFLAGAALERPDYLDSPGMGKSFALFLSRMQRASQGIERVLSFPLFSLKAYIYKLFSEMKIHDRPVYEKFLPFLGCLESGFMQAHDRLPLGFCHGDLHPLNVIWQRDEIRAVIDWEFAGIKPDLYDAANLVGCAGIENPNGLGMDMVMAFLEEIQKRTVISETSRRFFPEYVLALRFAWLSEWLRKKDQIMLDMEETYMGILVDHMEEIRKEWRL